MKNKVISSILIFQIILILTVSNCQFLLQTSASSNSIIIVEHGQSIQEAINNASEEQTIHIKKGIYTINSPIIVNKTVTLLGESVNETIIDGHEEITLIFSILANRVEIQNLTIRDSETHGFGIHIKDVANVKIQNCHIRNCGQGIRLTNSTNCEISRNVITNSEDYGIYFIPDSAYNTIFWNTIKNNTRPIFLDLNCKENTFYQNNFIQNKFQVDGHGVPANLWNSTYPAGGNHWSDYTRNDIKSGPYQNETGSDGIGDESYELPLGAKDHYPIIGPIHCFHAYQWENIDYYTLISSNISDTSPSNFHFDSNEAFIIFTLTSNSIAGFCRVAIPKRLLWVVDGWNVTVGGEPVNYETILDKNYTYILFAYNYSNTETVKIQGTDCIPEFPSFSILIIALITIVTIVILKEKKPQSSKFPPRNSSIKRYLSDLEVNSRTLKSLKKIKNIGVANA